MSAGFAMTESGDIDLNTLAEGDDARVLSAAIVLALQTFIGEWRGNLRIGIDRAMFRLRQRADIAASLRDGCTRALDGLPIRIDSLEVNDTGADRVWRVVIQATPTDGTAPLSITVPLL